jgi:hypothetical protein
MTLSAAEDILHRMVVCIVNHELESVWMEVAVAVFKASYYTGICISAKPQIKKKLRTSII